MEFNRFKILKMGVEDLDEVLKIERSSSLCPWTSDMFIEEMRKPFAYCFITKKEDISKNQVLGFICFQNIKDESELLNLCVHPQYRQMGIGKSLMKFYIEFCRKNNIERFFLEVNTLNHPAIHLYQSFSYQILGSRKKFYKGKFDAFLMERKNE